MKASEAKQLGIDNIPTFIQNEKDSLKSLLDYIYESIKKLSEMGYFQTSIAGGQPTQVIEQLKSDGYEVFPADNFYPNGVQIVKWGEFEIEHNKYKEQNFTNDRTPHGQ